MGEGELWKYQNRREVLPQTQIDLGEPQSPGLLEKTGWFAALGSGAVHPKVLNK